MSVLLLLVPLSLLIALGWVVAYVWAVRGDQLEDMVSPGIRILHDDQLPPQASSKASPDLTQPPIR